MVNSLHGSFGHFNAGDDVDNLEDSAKLVVKFSNQLIMDRGFSVPSGCFSFIIIVSISKILGSFLSEKGGFSDSVVGVVELSSVVGDSLVALIKGGLADGHESLIGSFLVLLILMSVGEGLMALIKDVIEHTEDSLDGALVGEVLGKSEHNLDHLGPFGSVNEVLLELLDVILGSLDLYE